MKITKQRLKEIIAEELTKAEKKRKKAVSRIAKSDAESIFKVIENSNPFADDSEEE